MIHQVMWTSPGTLNGRDQQQKWKSVLQWSPGWWDKQQQQGTLSIMALSSQDCSHLDESSYICGLLTTTKENYGLNLADLLDFEF